MPLDLPSPIAAYVAANARLDADGMLEPFTADAVVRDNGAVLRGHAEISALFEEAVIPVRAIFTPDWMACLMFCLATELTSTIFW